MRTIELEICFNKKHIANLQTSKGTIVSINFEKFTEILPENVLTLLEMESEIQGKSARELFENILREGAWAHFGIKDIENYPYKDEHPNYFVPFFTVRVCIRTGQLVNNSLGMDRF